MDISLNPTMLFAQFPVLVLFYAAFNVVFWTLVHVVFSLAVYNDAKQRNTYLAHPLLWALVTLFGGVFFAGVYWMVNRLPIKQE